MVKITLIGYSDLTKIELLDMDGRILQKSVSDKEEIFLNFNSYAPGLYFIKIFNDESITVKKVVII